MYKIFNNGALLPLSLPPVRNGFGREKTDCHILIDQVVKHADSIVKRHTRKQAGNSFRILLHSLYKLCDVLNGHIPSLKQTTQQKTPFALVWSSFFFFYSRC